MNTAENTFVLKGLNDTFKERQKNIFDQLTTSTSSILNNPIEDMNVDDREEPKKTQKTQIKSIVKQYRGKESIFKRPQDPLKRNYIRKMPDFKKNPHKWTKYSLADVKDEDMSDRTNTKAALSFLNDLKNRTNDEKMNEDAIDDDSGNKKIFFRKVHKLEKNTSNEDMKNKADFRSSKVIMPEYVVGQKIKKEKKNRSVKNRTTSSSVQLKLDHLQDADDDIE